jgi:hypothetical protein
MTRHWLSSRREESPSFAKGKTLLDDPPFTKPLSTIAQGLLRWLKSRNALCRRNPGKNVLHNRFSLGRTNGFLVNRNAQNSEMKPIALEHPPDDTGEGDWKEAFKGWKPNVKLIKKLFLRLGWCPQLSSQPVPRDAQTSSHGRRPGKPSFPPILPRKGSSGDPQCAELSSLEAAWGKPVSRKRFFTLQVSCFFETNCSLISLIPKV